ncbi:MAG TPA: ABC transporter substrate-binding protein [Candidatus Lustribacter sp.]|nr:ABC transporter substrate-binding protein [Candidatus Lustribacter sp.]
MFLPFDKLRLTLLAPALLGVAAVIGASLPGSAQAPATLKIATTPTDIGSEVFYAADKGFFKANGLDAQIQVISNGAAITAAVMSGALDVAQSNIASLAAAHEAGLDVVVIAPAGQYSSKVPTTALIVAKNSPIKTAKDLNGKTIAGNGLKNITQVGAFAWMDKNGGDPSSTKFIEMPFPDMPGALVAGRVDAAVIAEPELSAALAKGDVRVLANCYDGIAKDFLIGAWFTTGSWAKAHPDLVKRFAKAISQTADWANKNQSESAALLTKYTKIAVAPDMKRTIYAGKLQASLVQPLIDASAKYGITKATFPASAIIAPEAM